MGRLDHLRGRPVRVRRHPSLPWAVWHCVGPRPGEEEVCLRVMAYGLFGEPEAPVVDLWVGWAAGEPLLAEVEPIEVRGR